VRAARCRRAVVLFEGSVIHELPTVVAGAGLLP